MPTPRQYHKERIAHAEGYDIQSRNYNYEDWEDDPDPIWSQRCQYRIKPEPKPDIVVKRLVRLHWDQEEVYVSSAEAIPSNLLLVFDAETYELKSAEVIK